MCCVEAFWDPSHVSQEGMRLAIAHSPDSGYSYEAGHGRRVLKGSSSAAERTPAAAVRRVDAVPHSSSFFSVTGQERLSERQRDRTAVEGNAFGNPRLAQARRAGNGQGLISPCPAEPQAALKAEAV